MLARNAAARPTQLAKRARCGAKHPPGVLLCPALAALPLLLACGGCQRDAPPATPESGSAAPSTSDTIVRLEDDGKTLEVAPGSRVVFKLATNSGTGYAWVAAPVDSSVLLPLGSGETERPSDVPGAPKLDVLRFSARGPGTVTVQVDLKRPWGDQPAVKTLRITLIVH